MPAASFIGCFCTGHGCWPPRIGITFSTNVRINGLGAHRVGDAWNVHCCPSDGCHPGIVKSGAANVYINGRPAARIGDSIACGSLLAMGSPNVNIGASMGALEMLSMAGTMFDSVAANLGLDSLPSIPSVGDVMKKLGVPLPQITDPLIVAGEDITDLVNEQIADILSTKVTDVGSLIPSGVPGAFNVALGAVTKAFPDLQVEDFSLDDLKDIIGIESVPVLTAPGGHGYGDGDQVVLTDSGYDTNGSA